MKIKLSYDVFYATCIKMAEKIRKYEPNEIIAVTRGGLSASHIIAKQLNLPVGVYFPATKTIAMNTNEYNSKVVFVEDLVAKGRTFDIIYDHMLELSFNPHTFDWMFAPFLVDSNYERTEQFNKKLLTLGMTSYNWIVMPYEEEEKMVEGDRGLFRNGDDQYGK